MLETAWNLYRGWAARSRQLQAATQRLNRISLALVVATALLGTLSSQLPESPRWLAIVAALTAVGAAISAWLGREAFAVENETRWVKARSLAEAIKSECFRFAAGLPPYDGPEGIAKDHALATRLPELRAAADADDLNPANVPPGYGGSPAPAAGMDSKWYLKNRIEEQVDYFGKTRDKNSSHLRRLQLLSLVAIMLAAACGALAATVQWPLAAWTAAITTVAASVSAWGLADRSRLLAADAARMINRLGDLATRESVLTLHELVAESEDLLRAEHSRWLDTVSRNAPAPAAGAPAP